MANKLLNRLSKTISSMKRTQFSYLVLILVLLNSGACKKTDNDSIESTNPLSYSAFLQTENKENVDGVISLQSFSNRDYHLTNVKFIAEASFYENGESSKTIDVGEVKIAGLILKPNSNGKYVSDTFLLSESQQQFGQSIQVEISGKGNFSYLVDSIYSPEKIVYDTFCICSGQHIRKAPFPVRWNQDLNNNEVQIILVYDGISSASRNPKLPFSSYALPIIKTKDLGMYEIQSKTLFNFPPASFIKIYTGRKNTKIIQVSGKKIRLESITWTTRKLDLMY
jgi:hypothetical protein